MQRGVMVSHLLQVELAVNNGRREEMLQNFTFRKSSQENVRLTAWASGKLLPQIAGPTYM